ncbi:MAG: hypothetical protein IPL39_00330 [Opitutaceae bacterium]|nr:hypothetical protein [Opitutaceae bacterium]
MKNIIRLLVLAALVAVLPAQAARPEGRKAPAQVTFTVVNFRTVTEAQPSTQFTDATMQLAEHPLVTFKGTPADGTLVLSGPVDLEIRVVSEDGKETYKPVGITFEQNVKASGKRSDRHGRRNFAAAVLKESSLVVRGHFLDRNPEANWEFSVIIQRGSDGAIGIIDPGIENRNEP